MTELLSPSQIGPAMTRMSAACTSSKSSGQASCSHPCSVMSGYTPVAIGWSMGRMISTSTPCPRITPALSSTSPEVWLSSGLRLSVQLKNTAFSPAKS